MGAWNVLSIREDDHLSLLTSELKRLDIGTAALSEVRRPDCGEIMVGGHTYYWSGCSDGYHAQGVAVALSNKLIPMIIVVTPVNERIILPLSTLSNLKALKDRIGRREKNIVRSGKKMQAYSTFLLHQT